MNGIGGGVGGNASTCFIRVSKWLAAVINNLLGITSMSVGSGGNTILIDGCVSCETGGGN